MIVGSIGTRNFVTASGRLGYNRSSQPRSAGAAATARIGVRDFMTRLIDSGESIKRLLEDFGDLDPKSARRVRARTVGSTRIGLETSGTATTLRSSEELSTRTTMIDDRTPSWSGIGSTATVTIHGEYAGTEDAEYEVRGNRRLDYEVGDTRRKTKLRLFKNGRQYGTTTVPRGYNGEALNIDGTAGLTVSFDVGSTIRAGDHFSFQAFANIDVTAETDEAFDGSTGGETYLDTGVSAGSFEVNGETIHVLADDTIQTVLDRIGASDAGVDALYDGTTDTVTLRNRSKGAETITVGHDSSGFLAAAKLDTATVDLGSDAAFDEAIHAVGALSSVSSGSFDINGVTFRLDVTTDSLSDLIERVNDSSAGVVMSYSTSTDRLMVRSTDTDDHLTVENDTTGLFDAFGMDQGTARGRTTRGLRKDEIRELVDQIAEMTTLVNQMARTGTYESLISDGANGARSDLRAAIQSAFDTRGDTIQTRYGLRFHVGDDPAKDFMVLGRSGEQALTRALQRDPEEVLEMLFGTERKDGLLTKALQGLDDAQNTVTGTYGSVGLMLDIQA